MALLADRNFAAAAPMELIAATGADLLIRCKDNRILPPVKYLPDRTWLAQLGTIAVRVIDAQITVYLGDEEVPRYGHHRLVTTLTDHHRYPATELVELYHQRWEIETTYRELKSSMLGGRVLRARTPAGSLERSTPT